jgi:hypothetical protein
VLIFLYLFLSFFPAKNGFQTIPKQRQYYRTSKSQQAAAEINKNIIHRTGTAYKALYKFIGYPSYAQIKQLCEENGIPFVKK